MVHILGISPSAVQELQEAPLLAYLYCGAAKHTSEFAAATKTLEEARTSVHFLSTTRLCGRTILTRLHLATYEQFCATHEACTLSGLVASVRALASSRSRFALAEVA